MEPHILIGSILVAVGVVDALLMPAIITRKMSDPKLASMVKIGLLVGGALLVGLGLAFILEVMPLGAE